MTHPSSGDAVVTLLKNFEQGPHGGFAPIAYLDWAGHSTIGWGHCILPSEYIQQPISAADAERILKADVVQAGRWIDSSVHVPLTQSMRDALACFVFNVGHGAFLKSTLRARINASDYRGAADEFLKWNKATNPKTGKKEPLSGLTRRRQAERELFLRDGFPS